MHSSRRKVTAAVLAAWTSRSAGGLGLGAGAGDESVAAATVVEVVVPAMAAGEAGLAPSRPTTKAVVTPMAAASTPAAVARRIWDGRIADPPVDAPCWSGRSQVRLFRSRNPIGAVSDVSPKGL